MDSILRRCWQRLTRRNAAGQRGAAMVETVIVMPIGLLIIFAALEFAIYTYYQLLADGAAFSDAFLYARGADAQGGVVSGLYPQILQTNIKLSRGYASRLGQTNGFATPNGGGSGSRLGGSTTIGGLAVKAVVTQAITLDFPLLPSGPIPSSFQSVAYEPITYEAGANYDAGGSTSAQQLANTSIDYFKNNTDNAPPYSVGRAVIPICLDNPGWTVCSNVVQRPMALAEYLDEDNWGRSLPGVGDGNRNNVFWEAACHEAVFAMIANRLRGLIYQYEPPEFQQNGDFPPPGPPTGMPCKVSGGNNGCAAAYTTPATIADRVYLDSLFNGLNDPTYTNQPLDGTLVGTMLLFPSPLGWTSTALNAPLTPQAGCQW